MWQNFLPLNSSSSSILSSNSPSLRTNLISSSLISSNRQETQESCSLDKTTIRITNESIRYFSTWNRIRAHSNWSLAPQQGPFSSFSFLVDDVLHAFCGRFVLAHSSRQDKTRDHERRGTREQAQGGVKSLRRNDESERTFQRRRFSEAIPGRPLS